MINEIQCPRYAKVDSPPGGIPSVMVVLVHVLQRENFEDPPQRLFLQLVGDLLYSILRIQFVTIRFGPILAHGA